MGIIKNFKFTPPKLISLGFAITIIIGAILLNLPISSKDGQSIGFLNALFTATSANCVTGLVVVNTMEHWTNFGKMIIIILIQFGGIGFMSVFAVGMMLLKRKISLKSRLVIQASFNQDNIGGIVKFVKNVIKITFVIEAIGAVLLAITFYFYSNMNFFQAILQGIFHSISAFCNAGFDNLSTDSLTPFKTNIFVNVIIMFLIISGGLGYPVWTEIINIYKNRKKYVFRHQIIHMSLHSKIVLTFTFIIILVGMLLVLLFEWSNPLTIGFLKTNEKILTSLFQSVTLRTAGFNTINQNGLYDITKFFSCIFMLIGGSPASTAGGMKTITIGVIIFSMFSVLKGRHNIEAFNRTLSLDILQKALTVVSTVFFVVIITAIILNFTEKNNTFNPTFMDIFFECSSAAGTVGVTTGVTPFLSNFGKILIIFCMFLGRLSPITVVVALSMKLHSTDDKINFPDEKVIIG